MDNRRGTTDSVGAGLGEQLHDGWVHPCFAGDRNRRGAGQDHPGGKSLVVRGGPGSSGSSSLILRPPAMRHGKT